MTVLAFVQLIPGLIAAGVALVGAVGGITFWWKNRNTQNALTAANQTAAGMIAAIELVPASPQIAQVKETIKAVQAQIGLELTKQAGMVALTQSVVSGAGLGKPKANETSANNVSKVADAILQSQEIALDRGSVSLALPTIPGVKP